MPAALSGPEVMSAIADGLVRHVSDGRLVGMALSALVSVTNARSPAEADGTRRAAVAAGVLPALAAVLSAHGRSPDMQLRVLGACLSLLLSLSFPNQLSVALRAHAPPPLSL